MAKIGSYAQQVSLLNQLNANYKAAQKAATQIATGSKINSPADDASGYSIVKRMDVEIGCLEQANANTQTGNSMLNVASGAMANTMDILTTLKEKAIAAANSTSNDKDRAAIQQELNQYIDQINDNALVTYNGQYLMTGNYAGATKAATQAYTNRSLAADTSGATKLTDLTSRYGDSLNIQSTDTVTVSYVKDGKTYSTSYSAADTTLEDIFKNANNAGGGDVFDTAIGNTAEIGVDSSGSTVTTVDGKNAITVKAAAAGRAASIAGFTITITDDQGNTKQTANNALDDFSEAIAGTDDRNGNNLVLHTGTKSSFNMNINIGDVSARALGLQGSDGSFLSVGTRESAAAAINVIDNAIARLQMQQTNVGAVQSRLSYTSKNLTTQAENVLSAQSVIESVDMAKAITEYTSRNVLMQATQSMLAQSYSNSAWFLNLLG